MFNYFEEEIKKESCCIKRKINQLEEKVIQLEKKSKKARENFEKIIIYDIEKIKENEKFIWFISILEKTKEYPQIMLYSSNTRINIEKCSQNFNYLLPNNFKPKNYFWLLFGKINIKLENHPDHKYYLSDFLFKRLKLSKDKIFEIQYLGEEWNIKYIDNLFKNRSDGFFHSNIFNIKITIIIFSKEKIHQKAIPLFMD